MATSSFLVIQTAFLGDVVLATAIVEKLHARYPEAKIDFLLRKGNEGLLNDHPYLNDVLVWDKSKNKLRNLAHMVRTVRSRRYDYVINVHRFASSGLIASLSGAHTIGFDKNPLSLFFTESRKHRMDDNKHEVERNQLLIESLTDAVAAGPRIYPSPADLAAMEPYRTGPASYLCVAPTSVWFTKQFPKEKWVEFIDGVDEAHTVYLLGAKGDREACEDILRATRRKGVINLAGQLNFLESAALMGGARMCYVNDSAPMHMASAMDAPVTAIFCSTIPAFGFGPLSPKNSVVEISTPLYCRPCGLHGRRSCPEGHFKCALEIRKEQLMDTLPSVQERRSF